MTSDKAENYLAMFGGKLGAERNVSRYQSRDDASHIHHNAEEYYEWWYLDAAFDNGYHFVTTFHYRNAFLKPMVPSIQFFIYKPDGTKIERYDLIKPEEATAHPDYCDVRMGGSFIKDMGDHYEICLQIGSMGACLKLKTLSPSWKPGNGQLYLNPDTGTTFGWSVPVPNGAIEGELYLKDETIKVKGHGYHDHNWGNCFMHSLFENWYWGRIHDDKFCVDYGWVKPRDDKMPMVAPLLIATQKNVVLSTNKLEVDLQDIRKDEVFGREYANRLILTAEAQGVSMQIEIQTKRIAERLELPKAAEWDQHYYRFIAEYSMDLDIDGEKHSSGGDLLHEFVLL